MITVLAVNNYLFRVFPAQRHKGHEEVEKHTALAAENYQYAKVGCRPPGGDVRYSTLEAGYASSRLSPTQPPGGRLPTCHFFTARTVKSVHFPHFHA